jgi:hypothetical protein
VTDPEFDPDALQTLLRAHSRLVAATPPKPEEISA